MKFKYLKSTMAIAALATLAGCIDDNYDLSDIDTTARITVNDLVIPINLDQIKLSSIIKIEEGDRIQVIDGQYVVKENGTFSSAAVSVGEIHIAAPNIKSSMIQVTKNPVTLPDVPGMPSINLPFTTELTDFHFKADGISADILGIDKVSGNLPLEVVFTFNGLEEVLNRVEFTDINLQLPKGLSMNTNIGAYDPATGMLTIEKLPIEGNKTTLNILVDAMLIGQYWPEAFDAAAHKIDFSGLMGLASGTLTLKAYDGPAHEGIIENKTIQPISLGVDYKFADFTVNEFSGDVTYKIDNIKVDDIDLSDLPDILTQDGTNIVLGNPRIYVGVDNPLYSCGLYAEVGLNIKSYKDGKEVGNYGINDGTFRIQSQGTSKSNYCLAAHEVENPAFPNAKFVEFSQLPYVLSGDGIPTKLAIDLNPTVPAQKVTGFKLGAGQYGELTGSYEFIAPLQLGAGSRIEYSDTETGWSDDTEDLDKLTINKLEVSFNLTADVPVAIDLTVTPLGKDGKPMKNVTINPVKVPCPAQNAEVRVTMTGSIIDLDGIEFSAVCTAPENAPALSPDMTITITNLRPCVSGYYEDKL